MDTGAVRTIEIDVETGRNPRVVDLTGEIAEFTGPLGDGLVSVFVPHATAGLAIVEVGAGSDSDLISVIEEILPANEGRWEHAHGSPGHGRDHVLPALISPSLTIPVVGGRLALGTWQSVVLVDTNRDNRNRRVRLSFISG